MQMGVQGASDMLWNKLTLLRSLKLLVIVTDKSGGGKYRWVLSEGLLTVVQNKPLAQHVCGRPAVNNDKLTSDVTLANERLWIIHTEKLLDGCDEATTDISACSYLMVPLQVMHDDSADDYEDDRWYHQDDCQQRFHVDLQTGPL